MEGIFTFYPVALGWFFPDWEKVHVQVNFLTNFPKGIDFGNEHDGNEISKKCF